MFGHSAGDYLFHYTTLATALEHILPDSALRLGPFSTMRDPAESARWTATGIGGRGDEDELNRLFWEAQANLMEAKATFKVLSLTEDGERPIPYEQFGRGWAHPRLWEHYAGVHGGVCMIFDRTALITEVEPQLEALGPTLHGPVVYEDTPIHLLEVRMDELAARGVEVVVDELLDGNARELFFHKLTDWASEVEYRFVVRTGDHEPVFVGLTNSLRGVIVGPRMSLSYAPSLRAVCDAKGIELAQLWWQNGQPSALPLPTP